MAETIESLAKSDALPFQVSTALEDEFENKLPGEDVRLSTVTSTCAARPCSTI